MKQKRIIVLGASGTIGKLLVASLESKGHEVIKASRNSIEYPADIQNKYSLESLFKKCLHFDAVVLAAGDVVNGPHEEMTDENFAFGSKLMGQINAVRTALPYISENGSFTLVSGILTEEQLLVE